MLLWGVSLDPDNSDNKITNQDGQTGAPGAASDPVAVVSGDGAVHVFYRSADGHIQRLSSGRA